MRKVTKSHFLLHESRATGGRTQRACAWRPWLVKGPAGQDRHGYLPKICINARAPWIRPKITQDGNAIRNCKKISQLKIWWHQKLCELQGQQSGPRHSATPIPRGGPGAGSEATWQRRGADTETVWRAKPQHSEKLAMPCANVTSHCGTLLPGIYG